MSYFTIFLRKCIIAIMEISEKIKRKAVFLGSELNRTQNSEELPEERQPDVYHEFVLTQMEEADIYAAGDREKFLQYFEENVKQPILANLHLLSQEGWEN